LTGLGSTTASTRFRNRSANMLDVAFIVTTLAFFGLGALFVYACDRI
jgi:hypothetical protein